jgi:hypothetical protein
MTIAPEFMEFAKTTVMDEIFQLGDNELKWRLWVVGTSHSDRDWTRIVNHLVDDGIDMETWIAAAVSYQESLRGNLDWILGIPRG